MHLAEALSCDAATYGKREADAVISSDTRLAQPYFIIIHSDARWLTHWREFTVSGTRNDPPGPISNWRLLYRGSAEN